MHGLWGGVLPVVSHGDTDLLEGVFLVLEFLFAHLSVLYCALERPTAAWHLL